MTPFDLILQIVYAEFVFGLVVLHRPAGSYFRCTSSRNDISLRET